MIGDKIKQLREKRGLTQSELSIKSNIPQTTISGMENNVSSPTAINLIKLSKTLNVKIEDLLEDEIELYRT